MKLRLKRLNQSGFDHIVVVVVFVVMFALVGTWLLLQSHAATQYYQLKMGVAGKSMNLCLDDSSSSNYTISYTCNKSDTYQQWQEVASGSNFMIKNNKTQQCVNDPGAAVGTGPTNRVYATSHSCDNSTGVVFRNYGGALLNVKSKVTWTHSGKTTTTNGCINDTAESTASATRLIIYPCDGPGVTTFSQVAVSSSGGGTSQGGGVSNPSCTTRTGNTGQDIANCAVAQLNYWNANPGLHSDLIKKYCNSTAACMVGEWCAGFVSYVLAQSGHGVGNHYLAYDFKSLPSQFTFQSKPALGAVQVTRGSGAGHVQIVVDTSPLTFVSGNAGGGREIKTTGWDGVLYGYAVRK